MGMRINPMLHGAATGGLLFSGALLTITPYTWVAAYIGMIGVVMAATGVRSLILNHRS